MFGEHIFSGVVWYFSQISVSRPFFRSKYPFSYKSQRKILVSHCEKYPFHPELFQKGECKKQVISVKSVPLIVPRENDYWSGAFYFSDPLSVPFPVAAFSVYFSSSHAVNQERTKSDMWWIRSELVFRAKNQEGTEMDRVVEWNEISSRKISNAFSRVSYNLATRLSTCSMCRASKPDCRRWEGYLPTLIS